MLFNAVLALHSASVQSDVPIGELLQELKHVPNDIVKSVVVHLMSHILDQVLVSCNDPLIHNVGAFFLPDQVLQKWIEDEVLSSRLFKAGDILDEEAIGIVPR